MEYQNILLFAVVTVLAVGLPGALGCSELGSHERSMAHNETEEQKVYYSEYVVFGKAGSTVKGDSASGTTYPFSTVDGVRTIEFDVKCTYKAPTGMVLKKIYVAGVGNKKNQLKGCPPAPLKKNQSAVLYLRKLDVIADLYEIEFEPNVEEGINTADQMLDDLTLVCNLNEQENEVNEMCLEPLIEDCVMYKPKLPTVDVKPVTTPGPKVNTNMPMKPTPESENENTTAAKTIGKPIPNNKNDTYNTKPEEGEASKANSDGSKGGVSVNVLSQSLVMLISVLFILV